MKYLLIAFILLVLPMTASAQFTTQQGGTGTTTPSGILYGDGTLHLKTVSIGSGLQFLAGVLSATGGGGGTGVATTSLLATYPVQVMKSAASIIYSLAFGTTTSNTWAGTQTFTNNPILGALTGLIYGNSGVLSTTATTTLVAGTNISYSGGTPVILGSTPITINAASSGSGTVTEIDTTFPILGGPITTTGTLTFGGLTTSTPAVVGNIPYFSGVNTFANVGTSTLTASSPLTGSFTQIGSGGALGCQTASGSQAGCLSSTDWTTFNNKLSSYDAFTHGTYFGQAYSGTSTALRLTGNPFSLFASSTSLFQNASTTLLTVSGSEWITPLGTPAGAFLAVDPNGLVIATTSPTGGSNSAFSPAANYATVTALPSNTYNNGASGVGATITEVGTGALSVDGANPSVGQRVLVKNEGTAANNGLYDVTAAGSGIAAFVLTRDTQYNSSSNIIPGIVTYVISGATLADDFWALTSAAPYTIGTTALNYTEVSGGGSSINSIGPAGSPQVGPAVTLATSSTAFNGLTPALTITGTGNVITFASSLAGTLGVAGGGTGQTTFTSSQLLYGNGTNALSSVATSSVTNGTGISFSGTPGALVGGTSLTITNSGVTSNVAGTGISVSGATGAVTITNTGVISGSCPGGFLTCSGTNPLAFTLGTLGIANGGTATTTFKDKGVVFYNNTLGTLSQASGLDFVFDNTNNRLGVGTSTPWAQISVGSGGAIVNAENTLATSTSMTVSWTAGNQQVVRMGTAATTIGFSNYIQGQTLRLILCNPSSTSGAVTFTGVMWTAGTVPTKTTTADKCDVYSFLASVATSTLRIFGTQTPNFGS